MAMSIELYQEYAIEPSLHATLTALRNRCFPDFEVDRSYGKQLPHFRLLYREGTELLAQAGVDHRVIRVGNEHVRIFGVIDLCVDEAYRRKGIASSMLRHLTEMAEVHGVDFLYLVADDPNLYRRHGFTLVDRVCSWLRIDEHRNYGVAEEALMGEVMVKQIGARSWPDGPIDLLGYMF